MQCAGRCKPCFWVLSKEVSKPEHSASGFPAVEVSNQSIFHLSVVSSDISLSRFDLVFVLRDIKDKDADGNIAQHVLKTSSDAHPHPAQDVLPRAGVHG